LFSINGRYISKDNLNYHVQDMIIKDNYCILAAVFNQDEKTQKKSYLRKEENKNSIGFDQSGKSVSSYSKLIFKEAFTLQTIQAIKLTAPITSLYLTRNDSNLLVGLRDGKLIVIAGDR